MSKQAAHHPAAPRPTERFQEYLNVISDLAQRSEALAGARTIKFLTLRRARKHGDLEEEKSVLGERQECDKGDLSSYPPVFIKAVWENVLADYLERRVIRVRGIVKEEFVE